MRVFGFQMMPRRPAGSDYGQVACSMVNIIDQLVLIIDLEGNLVSMACSHVIKRV